MTVPADVAARIADQPLSAHLATSIDDRPHVAPVWYGYRDDILYVITAGRKLSNMRRNPRVAVSIEKTSDDGVEWNVLVRGTAAVSDDPERIEWASGWIYDAYDGDDADEDPASDDGFGSARQTDGGESTEDDRGAALVEVTIGSASVNVYE